MLRIQVSVDRLGVVNIPYMSQLVGSAPEKVIKDLGDNVFRNPAKVKDDEPFSGYEDASEYLSGKSGAYKPSDYASLSVTAEVAKELEDMGVPLRGCHGFNGCYDITDVSEAMIKGNAVFAPNKYLAVMVNDLRKIPDWEQFKTSVKEVMGDNIGTLTGKKLAELHDDYTRENNSLALYEKVKVEYDRFIFDMRSSPADVIIQSAYEIVSKDNITVYCQEYTPDLTATQYAALMSSQNALDEVYEQWCQNGELHGLDDISIALEETADRIQVSLDRQKKQELEAPKAELPVTEQEQAVKPKHKLR